jgi:hypothetical protein
MMKQRETIISPMVVLMHGGTIDSELQVRKCYWVEYGVSILTC